MISLELIDAAHGPRMVHFALEGREVHRDFGRVGGPTKRHVDRFEDEASARVAVAKWLLKLQRAGYTLGEHSPDRIAEIAASPDTLDPYLVYADWLSERGDIRGELINLQVAREREPDDPELRAREVQLFEHHGLRLERHGWRGLELVWRWGFVEGLRAPCWIPRGLRVGASRELDYRWGHLWIEQQLLSLSNHPSGRFVRRVVEGNYCYAVKRQANGRWRLTREAGVPPHWYPQLAAR